MDVLWKILSAMILQRTCKWCLPIVGFQISETIQPRPCQLLLSAVLCTSTVWAIMKYHKVLSSFSQLHHNTLHFPSVMQLPIYLMWKPSALALDQRALNSFHLSFRPKSVPLKETWLYQNFNFTFIAVSPSITCIGNIRLLNPCMIVWLCLFVVIRPIFRMLLHPETKKRRQVGVKYHSFKSVRSEK